MAEPERSNGKLRAGLTKVVAIFATTAFFASAVFLVALFWLPSNAQSASTALDVQPSLLLALGKPQAPAPKTHLRDLPSLTDEESESSVLAPQDLVTELNDWTYTQSSGIDQLFVFYVTHNQHNIPAFNLAARLLYNEISLLRMFLSGLNNPFLTPQLNFLGFVQNTLSPYR